MTAGLATGASLALMRRTGPTQRLPAHTAHAVAARPLSADSHIPSMNQLPIEQKHRHS